jgi:hypothetical protein
MLDLQSFDSALGPITFLHQRLEARITDAAFETALSADSSVGEYAPRSN